MFSLPLFTPGYGSFLRGLGRDSEPNDVYIHERSEHPFSQNWQAKVCSFQAFSAMRRRYGEGGIVNVFSAFLVCFWRSLAGRTSCQRDSSHQNRVQSSRGTDLKMSMTSTSKLKVQRAALDLTNP